jgi:hypothetical protein
MRTGCNEQGGDLAIRKMGGGHPRHQMRKFTPCNFIAPGA